LENGRSQSPPRRVARKLHAVKDGAAEEAPTKTEAKIMMVMTAFWGCPACGKTFQNNQQHCVEALQQKKEVEWTCNACGHAGLLGAYKPNIAVPKKRIII